jgi:hypothetical protein
MTKPDPTSSSLQQEASSVTTSPQRLQALFRVDPALGPTIASNPSASIHLLNQLALHHPTEVLANPLLLLRSMESGGAYGEFSLPALICLSLASGPQRDRSLLVETKRRIQSALDQLYGQEVSVECDWLYARDFTLLPEDCDGIIDVPLDFAMEVRANMYAKSGPSFHDLPCLEDFDSTILATRIGLLADFLRAIEVGDLSDYINEEFLIREDGGSADVDLKSDDLPVEYSLEGMHLCRDDEYILEFCHDFGGRDSAPYYDDGILTVPVEFEDEVNHRYQFSMGELGDLSGLKGKCPALPPDWCKRLAELIISA